jgi:hypothetical protein
MAIPTPRSFNRIMGDMINAFLSRFGIKSMRVGSPILALLEAAAQSDMRTSQDIFNLLNSDSLDRATGIALDRIGLGEDLPRLSESSTTGTVSIGDKSFSKISTKIYQGGAAPIIGTTALNVSDASSLTTTGSVYIGRGTLNYEGPIAYTVKTNNGAYWTLTLSTGTQKFHNTGESVILAQGGNRVVSSGTIIQTAQGNSADAVQFTVQYQATIPDGETSITGVGVIAKKTGVVGNVSAGAINAFTSSPFSGATVTNPLPFTNGQSAEDDTAYRERLKNIKQSRSKGTNLAIKTSLIGITSSDENKRIVSASIVSKQNFPATVYIDDGTGYEERSVGVAQETVVDSALGGEQYLQLASKRPQSKAFVKTAISAPYAVASGSKLAVKVGGLLYTHTFTSTDFRNVGNASAYEVAASINADANLAFGARTNDSGTKVVLFAKNETNEDIEVVVPSSGTDANLVLQFPLGRNDTVKLYKNDRLLSKDGRSAVIVSAPQSAWATMATGETLIVSVDGTTAVTYTFTDNDFVTANTGYTTLSSTNSIDAWVAVINAKIPGLTATNTISTITLASNVGTSSRASLNITGGTLVTKGMFTSVFGLSATGAANDFTFNRYTGQLALGTSLSLGDTLATGSSATRAFVQGTALTTIDITQSGGARLWFVVDGAAALVPTSLTTQTSLTFSQPTTNRVVVTASSGTPFANVQLGDWAIFWDPAFLISTTTSNAYPVNTTSWVVGTTSGMYIGQQIIVGSGLASEALTVLLVVNGTTFTTTTGSVKAYAISAPVLFGNQGAWRVEGVTNTTIECERTGYTAQSSLTLPSAGLSFIRTAAEIQPVLIPTGLAYLPSTLVSILNTQLMGATASLYKNSKLRVATNTFGSTGDIAVVAMNLDGQKLGFSAGAAIKNLTSHIASVESGSLDFGTPGFLSVNISAITSPINAAFTITPTTGLTSGSQIVGQKDKPVALGTVRYNNTKAHNSPLATRAAGVVTLRVPAASEFTTSNTLRTGRVSIHTPLSIGPNDTLTVIVDSDPLTKRYTFNTYRRVKASTSTYGQTNIFKDVDNGAASLFGAFGGAFDWRDFAVFMKSRAKTHDNTAPAMLWRYALYGPSGARMGYFYPNAPNLALSMTTDATTNNTVDVKVILPSGAAKTVSNIRSSTGFGLCLPSAPSSGIYTYYYLLGYAISTASRTTNVVTAVLTLPQGGTDPGLKVGDKIYFNDTSGLFGSGSVAISTVNTGTNTITFASFGADVGATATPGTVSLDINGEATFVGSTVAVGDIVTVDSTGAFRTSTLTSTDAAVNGQTGASYMGKTLRINTLGNQYFTAKSDSNTGIAFSSTNSTLYTASNAVPIWRFLGTSATAIQFYPLANNTVNVMATATQSLLNAPITGTALGGVGAVTLSSWEENATAPFWYSFIDGINYIQSITNYPVDGSQDYSLTFKDNITASLAAGSQCDWANEDIRLVPITVAGLTRFLNVTSVTGLSTVATIQPSKGSNKLTISSQTIGSVGAVQVPSGSASVATAAIQGAAATAGSSQSICQVNASDILPFFGGMYVSLDNTSNYVKAAVGSAANFSAINSAGVLDAQITGGVTNQLWNYGTTNVADSFHGLIWQIEKQGKFIAITGSGIQTGPDLTGVAEGMMVAIDPPTTWQTGITFLSTNVYMRPSATSTAPGVGHFYKLTTLSGATGGTEPVWPSGAGATVSDGSNVWTEQGLDVGTISASNQGLFRVVRVDNGSSPNQTIWIENANGIEELVAANVTIFDYFASALSGDKLSNNLPALGSANIGVWTVAFPSYKHNFSTTLTGYSPRNKYQIVLNTTSRTPVATSAGNTANGGLVQVQDSAPARLIKSIATISQNTTNSAKYDVKFDTSAAIQLISSSLGTVMTALDKLNFSTTNATGVDGYSYSTGLIGEAARTLYGDEQNPATYPGVVAAGSLVTISGPLVLRIQVSLSIRVRTGVSTADVTNQVKSAVAGVVNKANIGQPIAISDIVSAAGNVNGVLAVSVISPTYNLSNDLISVQPFQKPLIQNLDTDVLVSIVGT